jgi:hypothetical protein
MTGIHDSDDVALRTRFAELRTTRDATTLPFRTTLHRPRHRRHTTRPARRLHVILAAAATLTLTLGVSLHARQRAAVRADIATAAQLNARVEWRSATDALLHTGYTEWLAATPSLKASVIDISPWTEGVSP